MKFDLHSPQPKNIQTSRKRMHRSIIVLLLLFATVQVVAYHQGGSEILCWLNGNEVTAPAGLYVEFWPEPPTKWREDATIATGLNCSANSAVKISQGLSASDPDYFKHINIHSCKTEVAFCDPAARGPLITSTPEIRGNGTHYPIDLKLPAGGYTIIAHVKFYNYSCAVGRFVDVTAARMFVSAFSLPIFCSNHIPSALHSVYRCF
eukprot:TRINITY_DN3183_c0_g2_i5.p1 TRINITY_DN3183_c0_g2~~TRINITY_DN3183_c0_g2_i5.p1  ORF type:complete len:206 (-),score=20.06 TRINITY_DN3183_c0_g2_i5:71-688(-)